MPRADILVIGAGPAGIATAYALQQAGLHYRVVDRASVIGSTWNSLYPSLRLNTTRFYSHMWDMKFPLNYGMFPTARQYHYYLLAYVDKHRFNINLGVEIERVTLDGDGWRVESSEGVHRYPVVVSATGIFGSPVVPHIPGLERFQGELIHSSEYRHPDQARDKRVLVVGNGPSGVDIAIEAATTARQPVQLAIRTGIDLRPRYPYGLPRHAWMMIGEKLPTGWCDWLQRVTNNLRYAQQERYGLRRPAADADSSSAVPYRGPGLINAVRDGHVQPVTAPVAFDGDQVELADGTLLQPDLVVMATGFRPVLHQYLSPPDVVFDFNPNPAPPWSSCRPSIPPNGIRGWPLRAADDHPSHDGRGIPGYPGLYVVGTFYKGKGAMYNFNVEAHIAAQQIRAYLEARP